MFHLKSHSFFSIWSFFLTLTLINALDLNSILDSSQGFQVISEIKSVVSGAGDFKYKIANAGDIDNDGYKDIIIGDSSYDGKKGVAYVIYGTSQDSPLVGFDFNGEVILNPQTTGFKIIGAAAGDNLGWSVSSAGDINKDGYADILVGASGRNSRQGAAYVIYGGEKSDMKDIDLSSDLNPTSTGFKITGNAAYDSFGCSVSIAGDFDKDGYDDILIGAGAKSFTQGGLSYAGAAYLIYGKSKASSSNINLSTIGLDPAATGFMIKGEATNDLLGIVVSSAGDIDGDGYGDIMIAAPGKVSNRGAVYIIYGTDKSSSLEFNPLSTHLIPDETGFTIKGKAAGNRLGLSISAAGHVNKDGFADIIIGAPDQNSYQGVTYVIYGKARAALADIDLSVPPNTNANDGSIGGPTLPIEYQESTEIEPGRITQATSLISASQGFAITGALPGEMLGSSVSSAGDVNGDGYDDVIIGAPGIPNAQGSVYVIYGRETPASLELANANLPQATIGFSIKGNVNFGSSVGSAMDLVDNNKMKLFISGNVENGEQAGSYIVLASRLCLEHCEFCNLPGTCSICSRGFWLKSRTAGYICEKCPEGCTQCTSDDSCQACEIGYELPNKNSLCSFLIPIPTPKSEITPPFYGSKRENATKDVFDGTSIVGAALSSGSSLPINFGLVAKILRNVKYLDVTVSTELQETFISWRVNSGFLAAPKSWALKAESNPLPGVFSRYGLAPAFLVNYWKPFLMTLIGFALFVVFKGIEIVVYKGDQSALKSSIPRKLNLVASNFALTQVYSNLDDVILYFVLDARSTKVDGGFGAFSLILAVILLLVGGLIIGAHIFLLRKYQSLKALKTDSPPTQLQRFLYKYENIKLFFDDFKDVTLFTQSFLWIHLTRAVFSSLLFATLFEYPLAQLILLLLLNIGMIIFLFVKKPFKDFLNTFSQLFCEVILLIANISMLGLAIMDQNESSNLEAMKNMSKAVIILNAILLFGCAILMIIGIIKSLYESYMAKKKAPVGLPKLQNNRLNNNSEKFEVNKSQLGMLSTGSYTGQYETQDYLKTAGNSYNTEGITSQMEILNSNTNMRMPSNIMMNKRFEGGNYEPQLGSNNASFSYQADDTMNLSNLNLLSNNNNSFMRAESLLRPRRRNNIKMPGGIQTNPKSNFETPTIMGQSQNNNSRVPIVNNNNYGEEFEQQRVRSQRR